MTNDIPSVDYTWQQGADGEINLVYKSGNPLAPVNLTGYSLRMDINNTTGQLNYSVTDAELREDGTILIFVPHTLTLANGMFANSIEQTLNYDIFLREPNGRQKKILRGTIYYESSQTLWT